MTEAELVIQRRQRQILLDAIANQVTDGWRIEADLEEMATLVPSQNVNHQFHLVATIVTAGIWLLSWMFAWFFRGEERCRIVVTEFGEIDIAEN